MGGCESIKKIEKIVRINGIERMHRIEIVQEKS